MKGKAIIIDDEPLLLNTAKRFFNKHQIPNITYAQWHSKIVSDLTMQDIVFLDLKMPGKDGLDVINELAEQKANVNLVLLTGEDETILETAKKIAKKQGLNVLGSLAKPFEFKALLQFFEHSPAQQVNVSNNGIKGKTLSKEQCQEALDKEYIYPVFQPQVNVLDHTLDGVECLARLAIPGTGEISPAVFIPQFEQFALIDQLTFLLLKKALREIVTQLPQKSRTNISFNLSAISINKAFTEKLINIVNNSGMMPQNITFEITETAAIELSIECQIALSKLRLKGFGLALDDFGTGFSTIKQLNELPFNEIKIDRSFVADLETKNTSQAIVSSTAKLAQSLGYRLVVEGVETSQQLKYLLKQHSHIVQGYLYSKPLAIEALVDFVNNPQATTDRTMAIDKRRLTLLQSIKPVLLKPSTNKHYDFEHVLADAMGFTVCTFQDASKHLKSAKAVVLYNASATQLAEIKAMTPGITLYFLLADDVQTEALITLIEQGYSDVFPTFIYPEALCNKILTSYVAQKNSPPKTGTSAKIFDAVDDTFCTKTLQLSLALSEQHSAEQFSNTVFDFLTELGLETALCLTWGKEKRVYRSGESRSIPLLERLFTNLSTMGKVAEFSSRCILNGQFCSLLILNLPENPQTKAEVIAQCDVLMSLLNMKAEAILSCTHWHALNADIASLEEEFSALANKQQNFWAETLLTLDDVVKGSAKSFDLTEAQTTLLLHNIHQTLPGSKTESELTNLLLSLREIALQSDTVLPQRGNKKLVKKG